MRSLGRVVKEDENGKFSEGSKYNENQGEENGSGPDSSNFD